MDKLRILYDHQIFSLQRYGGISRYFKNLQESLDEDLDFNYDSGIFYTRNYYLQKKSHTLSKLVGKMFKESTLRKWNKRYSIYKIRQNDFDVFHPTYYHNYFLDTLKKPFVLTVHDMIHELFPSYFSQNDPYVHFKRILIENADHIIAISESTKNDIQSLFKVPDRKMSVIYHGHSSCTELVTDGYVVPFTNYILYVGERAGYKNFNFFISSLAPLLKRRPDIKVVCAGSRPLGYSEKELFYRQRIRPEQVQQINVTDAQLQQVYKKALVFVYPSLYEGFGLPLLEAFANDCPILASNISCFQEVGGEAIVYFNPYDSDNMLHAIESVILDAVLADQLRLSGKEQLKKFPMEACTKKTQAIYKMLAF